MDRPVVTAISRRRLYQDVLDKMSDLVSSGRVQLGDPFPPERDLSETYGVSVAVVREAFRVLENAGVVQGKQGGRRYLVSEAPSFGSLLTGMEKIAQRDLLEARRLIEGQIIRLAAERCQASDILALSEMASREHVEDPVFHRLHDIDFHHILAKAARNAVLQRLQEYINELRAARQAFTMAPELRRSLTDDHLAIVAALDNHDAETAAVALSRHLDRAQAAFETSPEFSQAHP